MKDVNLAYECQKCCITCNEDKKKCEYRKAKGRIINRQLYAVKKKKELEDKIGNS